MLDILISRNPFLLKVLFLQEKLLTLYQIYLRVSQSFFVKGSVSTQVKQEVKQAKQKQASRNPFLLKVLFLRIQTKKDL